MVYLLISEILNYMKSFVYIVCVFIVFAFVRNAFIEPKNVLADSVNECLSLQKSAVADTRLTARADAACRTADEARKHAAK